MTGLLKLVAAVLITIPVTSSPILAQQRDASISIALSANSPDETEARVQLRRILDSWDVTPWMFTRELRIDARAIPHSHPVLTVNTRYLRNDTAQVATFVHEQLHWFLERHRAATDSAIADLKSVFPDAPSGPPAGARDQYSTYLHLLVCLLEYDALVSLVGKDAADRTLRSWTHYSWVYKQVLERPALIRPTLKKYGLDSPDARASR